jgi:hypothetical protein
VAALAVLDAAATAGPVLPDDPFQVLELERDQRYAPEQDLSVVHPSSLSAARRLRNRPKVLVDVLVGRQRQELDELVAERHLLEQLPRLGVVALELRDLLLDRSLDVGPRDLAVLEPLPDL